MSVALTLGWREFRAAFRRDAPDGRDFLSLTLLLAGLVGLGCVLLAAQTGLTRNVADTLLGRIDGAGSPIRISASNRQLGSGLDAPTLARIEDATHIVHPLNDAEPGLIRLPGMKGTEGMAGLIVQRDNPLWLWAMGEDGQDDPLTLVIDRHFFAGIFAPDAYRAALADWMPPAALAAIPDDLDAMNTLYLLSRINAASGMMDQAQRGLAPVAWRIRWVESFPTPDRPHFLMPADIASGLALGERVPGLAFDPVPMREGGATVSALRVFALAGRADVLACLGPAARGTEAGAGDLDVRFEPRLTAALVRPCLTAAGWREGIDYRLTGRTRPALEATAAGWTLPCAAFSLGDHTPTNRALCTRDAGRVVTEPWFRRWDRADVYVPQRSDILTVRDELMALTVPETGAPLLSIGSLYSGALGRLGYLTGVMDWIGGPVALLALLTGAGMLHSALLAFVARRKRQYGLLLGRGMGEGDIVLMLGLQGVLTLTTAAILGFALAEGAIMALSHAFEGSPSALLARTALGQPDPVLMMPLTSLEALGPALARLGIITGMLALLMATIGAVLVLRAGLRRGVPPMALLQ